MGKKYWLMKSDPEEFGIDDLEQLPGKTDHWDGVRNYQARNFMRDDMQVGDPVASRGSPSPQVLEECKALGKTLAEIVLPK